MKIAVVGAGGVGGYFGGRLALGGNDVTLVARGPHLAAIRDHGLRLHDVDEDLTVAVPAVDHPDAIGPCDIVLFCVKSYDTATAAVTLHPLLGPDTAVVSLQNGVDNEAIIAADLGANHVVGGAAFIFATVAEPGVIRRVPGPARMVFGELTGERTPRIERFLAACQQAGIDSEVPDDIRTVLWSKYVFICGVAGLTAAVRLPLGDIRDNDASWRMLCAIMAEVAAVARAEGVAIGDDIVERQIAFTSGLPGQGYSSLYQDLVAGRRMEVEALHGTVVRLAARHGVPVPATAAIYAILAPWASRFDQ